MITFVVLSFLFLLFYIIALNVAIEPDYLYSTGIEFDLIDNHIPSVNALLVQLMVKKFGL